MSDDITKYYHQGHPTNRPIRATDLLGGAHGSAHAGRPTPGKASKSGGSGEVGPNSLEKPQSPEEKDQI